MSHLTVQQVLTQVDSLLPNAYDADCKRRWLTQAEGFVVREILRGHAESENAAVPEALRDTDELRVPPPYDELYRYYVEAQIHYANGEMTRYNNACTAWNNAFLTYRDFYARTHTPCAAARALHLC